MPQKMVVESQQCFGDGEYFLVDSRVGFGEAAQGYEFLSRSQFTCLHHSILE